MRTLLPSLIEKCSVTIDIAGDRIRLSGKGLFGTIAVVGLIALIFHYTPNLIALIGGR